MGAAMSCRGFSKTPAYRRAAELVDETYTSYRTRGHHGKTAVQLAAQALRITVRRAQSLIYGEPVTVQTEELVAIQSAFLAHLDEEIAHLSQRQEAIRARRAALESK